MGYWILMLCFCCSVGFADDLQVERLQKPWVPFKTILTARATQTEAKMRLEVAQVNHFVTFLNQLDASLPNLRHIA